MPWRPTIRPGAERGTRTGRSTLLVRRNHAAYFYLSSRAGGRVVRRYVASGPAAERAALRFEADRAGRRAVRARQNAAFLTERDRAAAADELLEGWCAAVEGEFLGLMAAAGWHRHKRTWRRRRMNAQERAAAEKRCNEVNARIAAGDPGLSRIVKPMFDAAPEANVKTWGGDLAARVVEAYTDRVAGTHLFRREAVARKLAEVRAGLEGEDPSPAERLLAERAAVCWLAAYEADLACLAAEEAGSAAGGGRFVEQFARRQDRAQRRYLQSVKAVEAVRRAAAPVRRTQVSFGGRLADAVHAGRN